MHQSRARWRSAAPEAVHLTHPLWLCGFATGSHACSVGSMRGLDASYMEMCVYVWSLPRCMLGC